MKSLEELKALRDKMQAQTESRSVVSADDIIVRIGMATCGIAAGAKPVLNAFMEEVEKRQLHNVKITQTGCIGMCRLEPIVEILQGDKKVTYVKMNAEKAKQIVAEHIVNGKVCQDYVITNE